MSMQRRQGWSGDDMGTLVPLGGSSGAKELIRLPGKAEELAPISGTLLRARFNKDRLSGYFGLAASLGGSHPGVQAFLINMAAAGLGEKGFARNEFSMAHVGMLVPSAMPRYEVGRVDQGYAGAGAKQSKKDKKVEDNE